MHVDVVHAGAGAGDHPQMRRECQQVRRHARLAAHDERVRVGEGPLEHLPGLSGDQDHLDLRRPVQLLESRLGDLVRHHHAKGHASVR